MPREKTLEGIYDTCLSDGLVRSVADANPLKICALMENARTHINSAGIFERALADAALEWMDVYTLHYEALRLYAQALLLLIRLDAPNHQCLFASLCMHYPHLELEWEFFERIRIRRNGAHYHGERISRADWQGIAFQMGLYIEALRKECEGRVRQ